MPKKSIALKPFYSRIESSRWVSSSFERGYYKTTLLSNDKIVQMGIFFLPCAVIDRATARKNAQMGNFSFDNGAPD